MKVGDLVRLPRAEVYWWSDKIGIIDRKVSLHGNRIEYRVFIPPSRHAKFNDPASVELISESR